MCQCSDSVLRKFHNYVGVVDVFLYGAGAVKNGTVNQDAHLIGTKVEKYLKPLNGA